MIFPHRQTQRPTPPFHHRQPMDPRQHQRMPNQRAGIGQLLQNLTNNRQSMAVMANKGVNGLSKTLGHVQNVMQVVQSAAPVVEQYGPMVKNIPAMYRMMKAFKEADGEGDTSEQPTQQVESNVSTHQTEPAQSYDLPGESKPKLFI